MQAQSQVEYTGLFTIQQHVAVQKGGLRPRQPGSAGEGQGNKHQRQGCEPTTGMRSSWQPLSPNKTKGARLGRHVQELLAFRKAAWNKSNAEVRGVCTRGQRGMDTKWQARNAHAGPAAAEIGSRCLRKQMLLMGQGEAASLPSAPFKTGASWLCGPQEAWARDRRCRTADRCRMRGRHSLDGLCLPPCWHAEVSLFTW